jgi:glucokinase
LDALLCGDIGGTHTRLALVRPGELDLPVVLRVYSSREYSGLLPILARFLGEVRAELGELRLRGAALGIPGPVSAAEDELWMVNLPWRIVTADVARALGLERVRFLNDFGAVALSVPRLAPGQLHALGGGAAQPRGPLVVLGAGTGLGEGFLVWGGERYVSVASEGGHTDFSPRDALQTRLLDYLRSRYVQAAWERVLSGPGLVILYEFLRDREGLAESSAVRPALAREGAPLAIARHGLGLEGAAPDPLCARTMDLFCSLYGAKAGNLALEVVATGGVYLAGALSSNLLHLSAGQVFRAAFETNPNFARLLQGIPVWVITHPNPGLLGAAIAAAEATDER